MKVRIHHVAVWVSALAYFALGALWFDPHLFGNAWMAGIGKTMAQLSAGSASHVPYLVAFLAALLTGYGIAGVLHLTGSAGAGRGVLFAILLWGGLVGPAWLTSTLFEGRTAKLWAIDAGYPLAGMIITGAIVGAWKKKKKEKAPGANVSGA